MNRNKFLLIAVLVAGVATMLHGQFSMDLFLNNSSSKSLTFGMDSEVQLEGAPPFQTPATLNVMWLEGPGDVTDAKIDEDYNKLSKYVKVNAEAALWKLYARNAVKVTFKLAQGSLPNGSVLKIYEEAMEDDAVDITDGMVMDAKADTTYIIDYRQTATTQAALASPGVKHVQMRRSMNNLHIDFDVPEGYSLGADSSVFAFSSEEVEDIAGAYTVFEALEGNFGSFNAATATLTMTNMTNVARVQFNYWFTNGTRSTEKAVVIVDMTDGLMTALVKKADAANPEIVYQSSVIAVDPGADGYAGTILTYKIDFDDETMSLPLTLKVNTPKYAPTAAAYGVQYCFTETEDGEGEYLDLPTDGANYTSTARTIYLKVKVVLTAECESGFVMPSITSTDSSAEVELESVHMLVLSGGTMDIDGNGVITEDDAIMMYNFIALGGVDDPESMFIEDIIQGIDETQVDAEKALALLKTLATFLDYDENGDITEDDAIMMYNFIALGGVDDPESMFVEDIIQGIDETQVNAEKALENFKKYASR